MIIISPRGNGSVLSQRKAVCDTRTNRGDIGKTWCQSLISNPVGNGPILFQSEVVSRSCRHSYNVADGSRKIGLAASIISPANDRAIDLERNAVMSAGGNRDNIAQ